MNSSTEQLKPDFGNLLKIYKFKNSSEKIHGYLVKSTAPINVEDENDIGIPKACLQYFENENATNSDKTNKKTKSNISTLKEIATSFISPKKNSIPPTIDPDVISNIAEILANAESPEIVIKIHGYSTREDSIKANKGIIEQYYDMVEDINNSENNNVNKKFVFLGYRWPSESPSFKLQNLISTFNALPILPRWILAGSFFGISVSLALFLVDLFIKASFMFFGIFSIVFSMIITLILLRVSAYFRDSYRANNYAASDLVELIRTLDENIDNAIPDKTEKNINRIKLSFIAHSMGCYVTTNTIRILSDVFKTDDTEISNIGKCFTLSRLILVAPDIPVETIIPRRANFLQASLRRFEESYIFSNEGDVVLRIASTAANYFSFPAKDRFGGYRLGNITVKRDTPKPIPYGIINLESDNSILPPFDFLEVRSSNQEKKTLQKFVDGSAKQNIANKFTYFDCTDYKDYRKTEVGDYEINENGDYCKKKGGSFVQQTPVSLATKKQALGLWGYTRLFIDHLILAKIDTHGGYFNGNFTKELIDKLAFFGFDGLLDSYSSDAQKENITTLKELSQKCKDKQIQVLLSPQRIPKQ
jgi:hypothetical protein